MTNAATEAAPAAPAAFGVAGKTAVATGARLGGRWAPEGKVGTGGSMARLSFADRMLGRYFGGEPGAGVKRARPRARLARFLERSTASWVFPFPWFADELSWLQAAQAAHRSAVPARPGSRERAHGAASAKRARAAMLPLPVVYVAPSMGAREAGEGSGAGPLGPYSPSTAYTDVARQAVIAATRRSRQSTATRPGPRDPQPSPASTPARFAFAFGPRVALPAGLGGAVAAVEHSRATRAPAMRIPERGEAGRAPLLSAPMPAALGHLAWADRALVRVAGAPAEVVGAQPIVSRGIARAPAAVYVAPVEQQAPVTRVGAPAQEAGPTLAPVFDDGARVSDDVFAAIARGDSGEQPASTVAAASTPAKQEPEAVALAARPSPIFGLLSESRTRPGAGLFAALAASPAAVALAPVVGAPLAGPTFDVRALLPFGAGAAAAWQGQKAGFAPRQVESWSTLSPTMPVVAGTLDSAAEPSGPSARVPSQPVAGVTPSPSPAVVDRRPGALSVAAQGFAGDRAERAADLALDFAPPELILAAARLGLGPADAARAVRAAAGGPGRLSALAGSVELALLEAIDMRAATVHEKPARAIGQKPEHATSVAPRPGIASDTRAATALPGPRQARGATLFPAQAARALGLSSDAESLPLGREALDIIAALGVAQAAAVPTQRAASRAAAGSGGAPLAPDYVWLAAADGNRSQISGSAVSDRSSHGRGRISGPMIQRAVRATRAASLAADGSPTGAGRTPSARLRAQAAWSVFPEILRGDLGPGEARNPATAAAPLMPVAGASARARAGASMSSLVAPGGPAQAGSVRPDAPEVATAAAAALGESGQAGELPDWIAEAAQKLLADSSGEGELSLAELTLVTAAPQSQIAARGRTVSSSPGASAPPAASHPVRGGAPSASEQPELDIEGLARDVYSEVLRMLELSYQRNGEP